uniref:Protein CUSTOS n=1 Tax=Saccoglossus kowalevskii TaxID=10224 RepID=A0ABM0M9T7_SACKO|nr:PREDICTED: uncharacterized protein C12orf43 homolog [Saccoglossus kowalevskii]
MRRMLMRLVIIAVSRQQHSSDTMLLRDWMTMLDSSLADVSKSVQPSKIYDDTDDGGFKLFSTSTDGDPVEDTSYLTKINTKRKAVPQTNSTDSSEDEDEKLIEAAVSLDKIVQMGKTERLYDKTRKAKGPVINEKGEIVTEESGITPLKKKKKKKKKPKHKNENISEITNKVEQDEAKQKQKDNKYQENENQPHFTKIKRKKRSSRV